MFASLLFVALSAAPVELHGHVLSVHDGDTFWAYCDCHRVKIRLAAVDAPELRQRFGFESRDHLAAMILGRTVVVRVVGRDRNGRPVGFVEVDGLDVNEAMLADGYGWQDRRYSKSKRLSRLQVEARGQRRGLWVDPEPVEPWVWRRMKGKTAADLIRLR